MSHLSILPTVYTRSDLLESSLRHEGFDVVLGAVMSHYNGDPVPVDLLARQGDAPSLGWIADCQGVLTMVGDLQRIARHHGLDARLQRVARRYALLSAVDAMDGFTPSAELTVQRS
ncbi:MAG: DUF1257 domain-containing protein [Cyanobacteriota bacterium]|nr:DUF1257 domain-containing protein [Cyanobacteriota bacterium]